MNSIITSWEHKGYVLQQSSINNHYMIFDGNTGKVVMHSQYGEKLTEEEAKKRIDDYIQMSEEMK